MIILTIGLAELTLSWSAGLFGALLWCLIILLLEMNNVICGILSHSRSGCTTTLPPFDQMQMKQRQF